MVERLQADLFDFIREFGGVVVDGFLFCGNNRAAENVGSKARQTGRTMRMCGAEINPLFGNRTPGQPPSDFVPQLQR